MVYAYFPRLRERRQSLAGYTSGGEQQMCAIGRALMSRPKMILLDEPSMGLAPQIVEEIFEIVKSLNESEGVSFLLAEQNTNWRCATPATATSSRTAASCSTATPRRSRENEDVKEFYLGIAEGKRKSFRDGQALQTAQAVAGVMLSRTPAAGGSGRARSRRASSRPATASFACRPRPCNARCATMHALNYYDSLETRDPARETRAVRACCRSSSRMRMTAPGWAKQLAGRRRAMR